MSHADICFYEAFEEEVPALRRHLDPAWRVIYTANTIQEHHRDAAAEMPPAPIISIRTQSVIPAAWAGSLQAIQTRSTGYDHLSAFQRAVPAAPPCGSLPKYCGRAVAEHAAMLWLALMRQLPRQLAQFSRFHRDGLSGQEAEGRTLLVAGAGDIGGHVAKIAAGLGMAVLASDPVQRHPHLRYVPLEEGLVAADVVVCAMNLTAANRGLFNYALLSRIRRGGIFVNVSRGELSPPGDLLRLLEEGLLGGVGLDVYEDEPALASSLRLQRESHKPAHTAIRKLMQRPDVILTPHNAFNTLEATERKSLESARELAHFLRHGTFPTPVV